MQPTSYSYLNSEQPVLQFIAPPTGLVVKFQLQHSPDEQSAYLVFIDDQGAKLPPPQDVALSRVTFYPGSHEARIETDDRLCFETTNFSFTGNTTTS
jgi:hypothetical protein